MGSHRERMRPGRKPRRKPRVTVAPTNAPGLLGLSKGETYRATFCTFCWHNLAERVNATALAPQELPSGATEWVPTCDMHREDWWEDETPPENRLEFRPL